MSNISENQSPIGQMDLEGLQKDLVVQIPHHLENYFSDSIFSLSKISPCSMASDIVLNFLASTEEPVFSCNQANILGCNVIDNLSRFSSFSNFVITTHENAKKHINIANNITYKNTQNIINDVKTQQNNMKDEDEMNEGEQH